MRAIVHSFDTAALRYDESALVQAQVAAHLVRWADLPVPPENILDIGSGTGLVTQRVLQHWPRARVTALDSSGAMLREAQRKIPGLQIIHGDAAKTETAPHYDAIFSSMALHWLSDPLAAIRGWQGWLKPNGRLYIAILTEGSFQEWRALCAASGLTDGLWIMPSVDFAKNFARRTEEQKVTVAYPSAKEFLWRLKATGTATPRPGHKPFSVSVMRQLLRAAPKPFSVSYDMLYIELPSSVSV